MNDPAPSAGSEMSAETAQRLGLVPAGSGFRSLAFAIDIAVWLVLATPLVIGAMMLIAADTSILPFVLIGVGWLLTGVFVLIQLITHGRRGVTVGIPIVSPRSAGTSSAPSPRAKR